MPVSRIRIVLEKVRNLDDHEPWFKGRGEFRFAAAVRFNNDTCAGTLLACRSARSLKIGDSRESNERTLNACLFDGFVAETDRMELAILPEEQECSIRTIRSVVTTVSLMVRLRVWVGAYRPGDEAGSDPRKAS
jgi:hypothetical protein